MEKFTPMTFWIFIYTRSVVNTESNIKTTFRDYVYQLRTYKTDENRKSKKTQVIIMFLFCTN